MRRFCFNNAINNVHVSKSSIREMACSLSTQSLEKVRRAVLSLRDHGKQIGFCPISCPFCPGRVRGMHALTSKATSTWWYVSKELYTASYYSATNPAYYMLKSCKEETSKLRVPIKSPLGSRDWPRSASSRCTVIFAAYQSCNKIVYMRR
jgi:hypothetical protein